MVTGSDLINVFESPLIFKLEFVSGELNGWIDYFVFISRTAVEKDSWGAIKSLF
ncbi:MAG: hypothetical protein PHD74_02880 [Candidatus Krumholzibacteria bacterium]|nr:hypothetical protein [Candidatus Krumholzibacteria bacterium]